MGVDGDARGRASDPEPSAERRRRYRRGAFAEFVAGAYLMFKGYRVLARRWKSRYGEIDLVVVRGSFVVFVEVKQRASIEAARASITARQRARVRAAAQAFIGGHARYQQHEIRFDLVFVVPGRWPCHIVDGL